MYTPQTGIATGCDLTLSRVEAAHYPWQYDQPDTTVGEAICHVVARSTEGVRQPAAVVPGDPAGLSLTTNPLLPGALG